MTKEKVQSCKKLITRALLILCIPITAVMVYYSFRYTEGVREIAYGDEVYVKKDSILLHILVAAVLFLIFFACKKSPRKIKSEKVCQILLGVTMLWVTALCFFWIGNGHFYAMNDSRTLLDIMEHMRNGDYSDLLPQGYLGAYRQQISTITLFRLILFLAHTTNDFAIQVVNVLCVPVIVFAGYHILREITGDIRVRVIYLFLMNFCFPLFLYTPYVYGEIISATVGMLFLWAAIVWLKREKVISWVAMAICAVIGYMARGNFLIVLIAFLIMAVLYSVRRKKIKYLICAVSMFLAVSCAVRCNEMYYEKISGITIDQGVAPEAWIAMGMSEHWELACGTYNGYNIQTYADNDYNREQSREANRAFIRDRLTMFRNGAGRSVGSFYKDKMLAQWNDPTVYGFNENRNYIPDPLPVIREIVDQDGKYATAARDTVDEYQWIVYLGLLACCFSLWKGKGPYYQQLLLIVFIGGFLFTALWETMARYVFPYFIYMIPLTAIGWEWMMHGIEKIWRKVRG